MNRYRAAYYERYGKPVDVDKVWLDRHGMLPTATPETILPYCSICGLVNGSEAAFWCGMRNPGCSNGR